MNSTEETSLIHRLNQPEHQRQAFEQLVNLYSPQLYRQIRRMVYSHDDTNDILQNTFIKAWVNLDTFRGDARLSTWLYRIATNETLTTEKRHDRTGRCPVGHRQPTDGRRIFRWKRNGASVAKSHRQFAGQATRRIPFKVLRRNEIRRNELHIRHQRRCLESLLPPCREKNMRFF